MPPHHDGPGLPVTGDDPATTRVSFVVDTEGWGGAEAWVAHHLRRASHHGIHASVVAAAPVAERFRRILGAGRVSAVPSARFTPAAPAVTAALERQRPAAAHVNLVDPGSNAAVLEAALGVAPTVATLHLPGRTDVSPGPAALAALYARLELVTTPSDAAARQVREDLAEPRGGVVVVQNGVEVPADPQGPARRWPPRVGVHCRLTEQKGVDVLVAACRLLVDRGQPLEVVVAGAGRDEPALRAAAAGLPVRFVGWASDPRAFLGSLDVYCLPSRREAMPLALLEALAEGLPCVATAVGDVRSVLGPVVVTVPPADPEALADALATVLSDPEAADDLAAAGRSFAERFLGADRMVAATCRQLRAAAQVTART